MCWSYSLHASDKEVNVGFVIGIPPFVIGDSGILVDLVNEALSRSGYKMNNYEFPSKQFDTNPLKRFKELDVFIGTPLVFRADYSYGKVYSFDNVAVSKESSKLSIERIIDLKDKIIIGFNNANQHLKEPFSSFYAEHLKDWNGYMEMENQQAQFEMLIRDRTEVILLDRDMVYYYAKKTGLEKAKGLVFHDIFPLKNTIYVVGRNRDYVAIITKNLEEMSQDGTLLQILNKYR
jgi:ABC-type amino acid transport substrate-binding protein